MLVWFQDSHVTFRPRYIYILLCGGDRSWCSSPIQTKLLSVSCSVPYRHGNTWWRAFWEGNQCCCLSHLSTSSCFLPSSFSPGLLCSLLTWVFLGRVDHEQLTWDSTKPFPKQTWAMSPFLILTGLLWPWFQTLMKIYANMAWLNSPFGIPWKKSSVVTIHAFLDNACRYIGMIHVASVFLWGATLM